MVCKARKVLTISWIYQKLFLRLLPRQIDCRSWERDMYMYLKLFATGMRIYTFRKYTPRLAVVTWIPFVTLLSRRTIKTYLKIYVLRCCLQLGPRFYCLYLLSTAHLLAHSRLTMKMTFFLRMENHSDTFREVFTTFALQSFTGRIDWQKWKPRVWIPCKREWKNISVGDFKFKSELLFLYNPDQESFIARSKIASGVP